MEATACCTMVPNLATIELTSLVHQITRLIDKVPVRIVSDLHSTVHFHLRARRGPLLNSLFRLLSTSSGPPTATSNCLQRFVSSGRLSRGSCAAAIQAGALQGRSTASISSLAHTHSKHVRMCWKEKSGIRKMKR